MNPKNKEFEREPFQFEARADWEDGKLQTEVTFTLPGDKRLIIENISATLECPIGQEITSTQVRTRVKNVDDNDNVVAWHSVFVPKAANFNNNVDVYCGGQMVRVYADPGTEVTVLVHKNSSQCQPPCGTTLVYISGYLLPAESPSLAP